MKIGFIGLGLMGRPLLLHLGKTSCIWARRLPGKWPRLAARW